MELKDTVDLMLSDKFEDRLKAEYLQTGIRAERLGDYLTKLYDKHIVENSPLDDEYKIMLIQHTNMIAYNHCLRIRLEKLDIELPEV